MTDLERLDELKEKYEKKCNDVEQARKGLDRLSNIFAFLSGVDAENYWRCVRNDEKERADDPEYNEEFDDWSHEVSHMISSVEEHISSCKYELEEEIKARDALLLEYMQLSYRLGMKDRIVELVRPFEYGTSSANYIVEKLSPKAVNLVFEDDVFPEPVCPICGRNEVMNR